MRYLGSQITFQEVPDEVSLSILVSGCKLRCPGCHSSEAWSPDSGQELSRECFIALCTKYLDLVTCVTFMGGEWQPQTLIEYLSIARSLNLKTCLYTGLHELPPSLIPFLDFAKVGPWNQSLGGLDSPHTNQKIFNVKTQEVLNFRFHTKEVVFDSTY